MKNFRESRFFRPLLWLGAFALAAGAYALARYELYPRYRAWSIARMTRLTRQFIADKDPADALVMVRKMLAKRPNDPEPWRMGVQASLLRDSSDAVIFQRNLCRVEKTADNYIELMRLSIRYGAYSYALEAIPQAPPEAHRMVEYHRLAAQVCRIVNRPTPAHYHIVSLLSLSPGDQDAQVALAELEFETSPEHLPADWAPRVARMAADPVTATRALVLQLRRAIALNSAAEARPIADRLAARTDLDLAQRLVTLQAAYLLDPGSAATRVAAIEREAENKPADVVSVMDFLAAQHQPALVAAWYPRLPAAVRQNEAVKLATARVLIGLKDWTALNELLRGARWKNDEALRQAYLAYACRQTGATPAFDAAWKLALIAAGQDLRSVVRLLHTVEGWNWDDERTDVLWRLFALMPDNAAVREQLIAREYLKGRTVNLNKIYARMLESNPDDETARNNFAYTSLLLNTNLGRAGVIARNLFMKHRDNVPYRTTYVLALQLDGDAKQGLALLDGLRPGERLEPGVRLSEALCAAAAGDVKRASAALADLGNGDIKMLPEEKRLATEAAETVARLEAERNSPDRLVAVGGVASEAAGGWMALLPDRPALDAADLQRSNSYYRDRDFRSLVQLLETRRWHDNDFLRQALLAYARRVQGDAVGSLDSWREAFDLAGRDERRLRDLGALAKQWDWRLERAEVVARIFERDPGSKADLAELMEFYRRNSRAADLARVLWLYVNRTGDKGPEAAWCVYYSLLCGTNVATAQTLASKLYAADTRDPLRRVAFAFSLWRQQRPSEALPLLRDLSADQAAGMQVALIEAGVLLELGRKTDAQASLQHFTPVNAMPEEIALAHQLSRQAGTPAAVAAAD